MIKGAGIKREEVTPIGVPCIRYGEIYTSYNIVVPECKSHTQENVVRNPKYCEYGDILFAATGESVEDIGKSVAYLGEDKCMVGGDIIILKHNQEPRFVSYALSTLNAQKQKSAGKVKSKVVHLHTADVEKIEILLPNLAEQKRLADILDNFHALCTDISDGIPAEIEARKKQYEYYRDKLLSFKYPIETGTNAEVK